MTRACDRRALRALDFVNDLLAETKWTIWCYEVEHLPAMIDLLIGNGTLRESHRLHCVHWTDVRREGRLTQDDLGRVLDADAMLDQAGTRTLTAQAWEASKQGPEAAAALHREWFGDPSVDDL